MSKSPSVTVYRHEGRDQIYAFLVDPAGNLRVNFFDADPNVSDWRWDNWANRRPSAQTPLSDSPSAIVSLQHFGSGYAGREDYLHAFVRGSNGHLYQHFWAPSNHHPRGTGWHWEDIGQPDELLGSPGAVAYAYEPRDDDDDRLFLTYEFISVFIRGHDGSIWRVSSYGSPAQWKWFSHGKPGDRTAVSDPAVIAYRNPRYIRGARRKVYAFVIDSQGDLRVTHTRNSHPESGIDWQSLGSPNVPLAGRPAVTTFWDGQYEYMFTFVVGQNGRMYMCGWDGFTGPAWADLGIASSYQEQGNWVNPLVSSPATVTAFRHQGSRRMYAFVGGSDNFLHVWYGTRYGQWAGPTQHQLGKPPGGVQLIGSPTVARYFYDRTDRMYVFVWGQDNRLKLCYWDGVDQWHWRDQGLG